MEWRSVLLDLGADRHRDIAAFFDSFAEAVTSFVLTCVSSSLARMTARPSPREARSGQLMSLDSSLCICIHRARSNRL